MHTPYLLAFLSLIACSLGIQVTSPSQGTTWSSSGSNTITWTRVSTDPDNCAITLVQQGVYKQTLADDVSTSKGTFTVTGSLPTGSGYQVNLVQSSQQLNAILAQSAQFNITQGSSTQSSLSASSTVPSGATGTVDIPNSSNSALTPSKSSAATSVGHQGGLLGLLTFLGFALI